MSLNHTKKLSLPVALFFNLVILVGLTMWFLFANIPPIAPCVAPLARAASEATIVFLLGHIVWHYLGERLGQLDIGITVRGVKVPFGVFAILLDELNLRVTNKLLWGLVLLVGLPAVGILSAYSPFPISEAIPIAQNFTIRYDGISLERYPQEVVEIPFGKQVLVEAKLLQPGEVHCTWSANSGTISLGQGCSTYYSLPLSSKIDTLILNVQSICKTRNSFASLHIRVAP